MAKEIVMASILKVPAMIVGELRAGLCSILDQAAWDVSTVMDTGCTCHPQRVEDLLQRMDCARALLELIGWTQTVNPRRFSSISGFTVGRL